MKNYKLIKRNNDIMVLTASGDIVLTVSERIRNRFKVLSNHFYPKANKIILTDSIIRKILLEEENNKKTMEKYTNATDEDFCFD